MQASRSTTVSRQKILGLDEAARRSMLELLGDTSGRAALFHLQSVGDLSDPVNLRDGLVSIFGEGAPLLMISIQARLGKQIPW